ncbi:MAG: sodium:solute symporter family protein [Gammaproteobacteria bacterium]
MIIDIDTSIVLLYLIGVVSLGVWAGRNVRSFSDYAVADRSYSAFIIFASLAASFIGGGFTMGNAEKTFLFGIASSLVLWGFSLKEILVAKFIAPRMGQFSKALSLGDMLLPSYGLTGKVGVGIFSVLFCMGLVGAQVSAIGYIFEVLLNVPRFLGVTVGCGIVVAYVTLGGIRAVVLTDIIQFLVLAVGLPLTLLFGLLSIGSWSTFVENVPADHFTLLGSMSLLSFVSLFISFFLGEALVPPYVLRLLIAKNARHAARGTLWSGLFSIPFLLVTGFIGLVAFNLDPSLNANLALPYTVQNVLPIGLKGIVIAAIISVVMSSSDSFLNSAGVALTNDIVMPLRQRPLSPRQALIVAKLTTLFVGIAAIIFALNVESVLDLLLLAYDFWAPAVLPLIVAAIFGLRANKYVFCSSVAAGVLSMSMWKYVLHNPWDINGLIIGTVINSLVLIMTTRRQRLTFGVKEIGPVSN